MKLKPMSQRIPPPGGRSAPWAMTSPLGDTFPMRCAYQGDFLLLGHIHAVSAISLNTFRDRKMPRQSKNLSVNNR